MSKDIKPYGKELILDLHNCDSATFTRQSIECYLVKLCGLIDMQRQDLHFWDDEGVPKEERRTEPHIVGISAVQFILTSNITIHALTFLKSVYINIFSCKEFDSDIVATSTKWFGGKIVKRTEIIRK